MANFDDECEYWMTKRVFFANDPFLYNTAPAYDKIDSLSDLNMSANCSPRDFQIENLKIVQI